MANSGAEGIRIMQLQAKQEKKKKEMADERKKVHEENTVRIGSIDSQFNSSSTNADDMLVQNTVGLVSLADYKKTKGMIEANIAETQMQEESRKRGVDEHEDGRKKKKKKKKKVATSKLSFGDEVEEEEEAAAANAAPKERLGKCTTVDTAYLPDRERAEEERLQRVTLKREWVANQDMMKDNALDITYSYWDGHGHRKSCTVKNGSTIDSFLKEVQKEFPELRGTSSSDLVQLSATFCNSFPRPATSDLVFVAQFRRRCTSRRI